MSNGNYPQRAHSARLISHPRQPAVFLSHALRHLCGEALALGAKEDVVVRHQRGGAYGRNSSRGVHLW